MKEAKSKQLRATITRMVHAIPHEAHNLLSMRNMHHSDQLSTTQQTQNKEAGGSLLEPGHTMMWLLGMSTIFSYKEMARRIAPNIMATRTIWMNASKPTNLTERTYPPKNGVDKNHTDATVPRIMDHKMVLDTLPHPTRSAIRTFRTFLGIAILAGSCAWPVTSPLFTAEPFPYAHPSSQQRSAEHHPPAWPPFSLEEKTEIEPVNHSLHIGNATFVENPWKSPAGDLDRTVFPTRKLDGESKLSLAQA